MRKYVAYIRVSTTKQGLGLDAQRTIINNYCMNEGSEVIEEFCEKESGKETTHRPELANALRKCKEERCWLIVAKLDRFSRDVADTFHMFRAMNHHIIVCNQDVSDTLTLGIFSSLAQKERELISKRTKEALAELKAQGKVLGNPKTKGKTPYAIQYMRDIAKKSAEVRHRLATESETNQKAWAVICDMQGTLRQKAAKLNQFGFYAPRGGLWGPSQVRCLIKRYG